MTDSTAADPNLTQSQTQTPPSKDSPTRISTFNFFTLILNKNSKANYELAQIMKQCLFPIALIQEPNVYAKGLTGFSRFLTVSAPLSTARRAAIIAAKSISMWPAPSLSSRDVAVALWKRGEIEQPIVLISMYCQNPGNFEHLVPALNYAVSNNYQIIISGDANSHSTLWGYSAAEANDRGRAFDSFIAGYPVQCLNQGYKTTWRAGSRFSVVDVALCTSDLESQITSWKVTQNTSSDHLALQFNIRAPPALPQRVIA